MFASQDRTRSKLHNSIPILKGRKIKFTLPSGFTFDRSDLLFGWCEKCPQSVAHLPSIKASDDNDVWKTAFKDEAAVRGHEIAKKNRQNIVHCYKVSFIFGGQCDINYLPHNMIMFRQLLRERSLEADFSSRL